MPTYLFLRRLRRSPAAFSGLTLVILLVLTALFAPWLAPHDPNWQDAAARLQGPGAGHWLGTDSYGRDLLSRLLYGARPALGLVALVTAITLPVGLLVGIPLRLLWRVAGADTDALYRRGDVDAAPDPRLRVRGDAWPGAGQRRAGVSPDHLAGLRPSGRAAKFSACAIATTSPRRRCWAFAAGGCWSAIFCRCVCRRRLSGWRLDLAGIILAAAGLGFLGLGARPPMAEWGAMIADGMQVIFDQWWIAAIPGAAILLASLAFNLLGDGLRDILEPQHD